MAKLSLITLLLILLNPFALSAANRFSLVNARPVADGGSLLTVQESTTLTPWDWAAGTLINYSHLPLLSGAGVNNIKRYWRQHFYGTMGITQWLDVSLDLPVFWHNQFINPDTNSPAINKAGLGDLQLSPRLRLLNRHNSLPGIGIAPFVTFPTGRESLFMGDDGFTGGVRLILDGMIGSRLTWALNIGGRARKNYNAYGLNFNEQFLLSGGLNFRTTDFLAVVGEIDTQTPFGDFFQTKDTSPTEWKAGLQWTLGKHKNVILNTAGTFGVAYGTGAPKYGAWVGVTFNPSWKFLKHHKTKSSREKTFDTIYFGFDSASITPESAKALTEIGKALSKHRHVRRIIIRGYTDSIGTTTYNLYLSKKRADAVKEYLWRQRSLQEEIEVIVEGRGEIYPIASNKMRTGRAKNRRVQIIID
jgi:outer membrane protein OmpA-like peptidoglycan-associated protein